MNRMAFKKVSHMSDAKESPKFEYFVVILGLIVLVFCLSSQDLIRAYFIKHKYLIASLVSIIIVGVFNLLRNYYVSRVLPKQIEKNIFSRVEGEDSVYAGVNSDGLPVYIKQTFRKMHTQVIGTTNAGKTESIIVPWAVDDIKKGKGFIVVDGKSDAGLLEKLYAYAGRHNRLGDLKILSLCNVEISNTFNPLTGGSPLEITERIFASLSFENEYFKSIQYDTLLHCLLLMEAGGVIPTPCKIVDCLKSEKYLAGLAKSVENDRLRSWTQDFLALKREEREQRTSGLVAQLQNFAVGETASIFNSEKSDISLDWVLDQNQIVYCQLPALKIPTLGKATGKLILQCLQSAVSSRHLGHSKNKTFFSVYLDDFTEYLTPSFATLLNKSRSANVGIVFSHQALGDLEGLGDGVKNTILTNSNLKVFMRTNEPESAEYFSSLIGTVHTSKVTERQKAGFFGVSRTGDGSVREAEEFKFHPNVFKQELGVGQAVIVLPHDNGSLPLRVKLQMCPDLGRPQIPNVAKNKPMGMVSIGRESITKEDAIKRFLKKAGTPAREA